MSDASRIQFMLQTEFGKSIALIVIVGLVLLTMMGWSLKYKTLSENLSKNGMKIALFIITTFIALQLIGDGAGSVHDNSIENVPEEIKAAKIINFTVGIILGLIILVAVCAEFDMCKNARSSLPSVPFMNFGKALGFGRKRKKRRC